MFKSITITMMLTFSCTLYANSITWLQVDFAPYYILQGDNKGQGRDEGVINLLKNVMPNYQFNIQHVPSSRALHELKINDAPTCMLSLYKTEQRKKDYFFSSNSSTIGLAPTIALHSEVTQSLNVGSNNSIYLKDLVFKHQLMLGKSMRRSYGEQVDGIINNIPSDRIIVRAGKDSLKSLTYMLVKRRIDLIIGYPGEHVYLQSKFPNAHNLIQLQIKEASKTVKGYIGCNKIDGTGVFLEHADKALIKIKQSEDYQSLMLRWVPENLKAALIERIK